MRYSISSSPGRPDTRLLLAEIAEVLGHKTLAMVKCYAHLSEANTPGVVEKMNYVMFGE